MPTSMRRQIVNCATGEVTIEDYTPEEVEQAEAEAAAAAIQRQQEEEAAEAKEAALNSAQEKLRALGLDDEEIEALIR